MAAKKKVPRESPVIGELRNFRVRMVGEATQHKALTSITPLLATIDAALKAGCNVTLRALADGSVRLEASLLADAVTVFAGRVEPQSTGSSPCDTS